MPRDPDEARIAVIRFEAIGEAWRLFRDRLGLWVLAVLIVGLCNLVISFGVGILLMMGRVALAMAMGGQEPVFLAVPLTFVPLALSMAVQGYFLGGMYRMALKQVGGEPPALGDLFLGTDAIPGLVLSSLLVGLATLLGYFCLIVPGVVLSGLFMFALPLVVDRRLSAVDALERSFQALKSQWLMAAAFHLVLALVSVLGIIACFVGLLLTIPIYPLGVAVLYRDFFPMKAAQSSRIGGRSRRKTVVPGELEEVGQSSGGIPPWAWIGGSIAGVVVLMVAFLVASRVMGNRVNWEKFADLHAGMTREEVENLVGPGEVVSETTLPFGPAGKPTKMMTIRWAGDMGGVKQKIEIGFIDNKMGVGPGGGPRDMAQAFNQLAGGLDQMVRAKEKPGKQEVEVPKGGTPNLAPPLVRPAEAPMGVDRALTGLKGLPAERMTALRWLADSRPDAARRAEVARELDELLIGTDDPATRDAAARAMVTWATPENVPTLSRMLEHPSEAVRKSSIEALGKLKDARATRPLAQRLGNAFEWPNAFAAIQAIGPAAAPELIPMLSHEDTHVRENVRKLLKILGTTPDVDFLQAKADLESADEGRRQAGAGWFERAEPDDARRAEVARLLGSHLGENETSGVRDACIKALAKWATADDVPTLLTALEGPSAQMRENAMQTLAGLKDRRAVAPIARRLVGPDRQRARTALIALGPLAEGEVASYLRNTDRAVRLDACAILKAVGTKNSLSALKVVAMRDRDRDVARSAVDAMRAIGSRR